MLPKIALCFTSLFIFLLQGCENKLPSNQASQVLPGEYGLFIGSNQPIRRNDLLQSRLVLLGNGNFTQTCDYKTGQNTAVKGSWKYIDGNIHFDKFLDCLGVWPENTVSSGGASLIVEFKDSPLIILNPDINVFYEKAAK